ncbi:protein GRAVITROPIC IN THE LIGHT 1-like [Phragmites australis]|uniref:protein GRAVITROPIC IN THE LIGHT 1-like n=1 Tax=Phragmites australis TaxID=29695 RepID=UPI002D772D20|nr:protein GRAVITROPIC IN THE LIGHT 1-like [Phragmites australis]
MLHKFALAFKTKTIEFFAEEEEEDEDADRFAPSPAAGADGVLAGQRVVVLKPDPMNPSPSADGVGEWEAAGSEVEAAVEAALATASSFQAAYLHLQAAHAPFLPEAAAAADAAAVSHLRRLSELKRLARGEPAPPGPEGTLTAHLEAQVRENQALLRSFDAVVNRLQAALDAKDAAAASLRREHEALDDGNARLAARLDRALAPPPTGAGCGGGDAVGAMLSASVFDSVLRDALRVAHRFARALAEVLRCAGWDLAAAAAAAYPDVCYSKPGHCRYALLSRVCLSMFDSFDSYQFGSTADTATLQGIELAIRQNESLQQFIEHSDADPMELMHSSPDCEFAQFCDRKYKQLIHPGIESSLFGNSDCGTLPVMGVAGPLYELFIAMASSIWTLHRLAWAYDPAVGIFQVGQGTEYSSVYMENIVRSKGFSGSRELGKLLRPKVGFTVVPGFRLGGTVIQCRVYLDCQKREEGIIDLK